MSEPVPADEGRECVAAWCAGEEWCGVSCAMEVVGKKWHPVIVQRLLAEPEGLRFSELGAAIDGVTNKVLSESLDDLAAHDVVERTVVNDKPVEVVYALTDHGRTLEPVIESLEAWGRRHRRRDSLEVEAGADPSGR